MADTAYYGASVDQTHCLVELLVVGALVCSTAAGSAFYQNKEQGKYTKNLMDRRHLRKRFRSEMTELTTVSTDKSPAMVEKRFTLVDGGVAVAPSISQLARVLDSSVFLFHLRFQGCKAHEYI